MLRVGGLTGELETQDAHDIRARVTQIVECIGNDGHRARENAHQPLAKAKHDIERNADKTGKLADLAAVTFCASHNQINHTYPESLYRTAP